MILTHNPNLTLVWFTSGWCGWSCYEFNCLYVHWKCSSKNCVHPPSSHLQGKFISLDLHVKHPIWGSIFSPFIWTSHSCEKLYNILRPMGFLITPDKWVLKPRKEARHRALDGKATCNIHEQDLQTQAAYALGTLMIFVMSWAVKPDGISMGQVYRHRLTVGPRRRGYLFIFYQVFSFFFVSFFLKQHIIHNYSISSTTESNDTKTIDTRFFG